MANHLTDMNKIRKAIKMHHSGKSKLFISNYLSLSRNTVKKYISLLKGLGLGPEDIAEKSDSELELLFSQGKNEPVSPKVRILHEYFPGMERELKKVGVTVRMMWEEYISQHKDGFQESQFRHYYRIWSKQVNPVMRMQHKSGDKMYVDYAGQTLLVYDRTTGESREIQFFVAILGASQYTYAEASPSQKKEDFVRSVENAMIHFEGVPAAIVPDNLKSAVVKSNRYEPTINETLADLAEHYDTSILPARVYKPRDKSLVEGAVKILYRRIYAYLKDRKFYSLGELNTEIWRLLDIHNERKLTNRPYSRKDLFLEDEKPVLRPLPATRFEIKYQCVATVMKNGHVLLGHDKAYYSVPYPYIRKKVKILYTSSTVEIYHKYNRIALHKRSYKPFSYTTEPAHLASTHRFVSEWSASRFLDWAGGIDPAVGDYILQIIESRNHPEQAYKSCMGILSFEKRVGRERLINACKRGQEFENFSYKAIERILENNLDQRSPEEEQHSGDQLPEHANIRGKHYYN